MKVKLEHEERKNGPLVRVSSVNRSRFGPGGTTLMEQSDRNGDGEEKARAWAAQNGHEVA